MKLKKTICNGLFALGMAGAAVAPPASALDLSLNLGGTPVSAALDLPVFLWSAAMDFEAWVTMLNSEGGVVWNPSYSNEPTFHGWRTPVKGKMVLEMGTNGMRGAATFEPFSFFGLIASGHDVQFYSPNALLNMLPTNTLMLGNMLFNWGTEQKTQNIPVSVVLDIAGLTTALSNTVKGQVLEGLLTAESDDTLVNDGNGGTMGISMGRMLVVTTSYNTTDVDTDGNGVPGPLVLGTNPSGTTPLLVDKAVDVTNGDIGIGGSPIKISVFRNFSPNFDISKATVTCASTIYSCNTFGMAMPAFPLSAQP